MVEMCFKDIDGSCFFFFFNVLWYIVKGILRPDNPFVWQVLSFT